MTDLIDVLPGIELPVGDVTRRLATMWESGPGSSLSEFRASQMNLVLHFGLDVTEAEARERFETLIRFAQRYPSRIIVLCPLHDAGDGSMQAKLFSQCYIGESHREMCCCEALLLGYKSEDCGYLANQVSIWLESDLPTYHWFSGVPAARIEKYFANLLVGVRRSVYDSSFEKEDLSQLDWPDPARVNDLAKARLLPVRQTIGQYLSGYGIEKLCRGLKSVTVSHSTELASEARHLIDWLKDCLSDCDRCETCPAMDAAFQVLACESGGECSLELDFGYDDDRYFRWRKFSEGNYGEMEAHLGSHVERIPTRVKPLAPESALSEALFF
ncbi:glucose-6-phosphate dehydrogenase assembly protein OpcA [Coraliomargarita parva]|uniref:glucose-6-phosphate dehydrogenase assembly protein OpcA n=1 Tax=Coraliomargarita parva TaxID=3014050 RepID=UPI0022B2F711|nr:glucose-6-phosphate dehydrogenase assembly protein OpcA [Coraliomargarita parva]